MATANSLSNFPSSRPCHCVDFQRTAIMQWLRAPVDLSASILFTFPDAPAIVSPLGIDLLFLLSCLYEEVHLAQMTAGRSNIALVAWQARPRLPLGGQLDDAAQDRLFQGEMTPSFSLCFLTKVEEMAISFGQAHLKYLGRRMEHN
jgi:hypothetical protein